MNTETYILKENLNADITNIQLPELTGEEKSCIEYFIELTRHIQEIEQLFCIFRFNLNSMQNYYIMNNDDTINRRFTFEFEVDDDIGINALVINYLSSAKTLTESIEMFIKENIGEISEKYQNFKTNCLSKIYDENFYYRFLIHLRDFSQHGHLPVSRDFNSNKYCFDLDTILQTPHFTHNKKLRNEMEKYRIEINAKYIDNPRIMFTKSIAEFNVCIIKIYVEFLNEIESILSNSINEIKVLLATRPDIIYKSKDCLNGWVFYNVSEDGNCDCFNPKDDSMKMFMNFKKKAEDILSKEQLELDIFNSTFKEK